MLSFLVPGTFEDLNAAVAAALEYGGVGEVHLVRNVTLAELPPVRPSAVKQRVIFACVPQGATLKLRSAGPDSPFRIRNHRTNPYVETAIFQVSAGARLVIESVNFEVFGNGIEIDRNQIVFLDEYGRAGSRNHIVLKQGDATAATVDILGSVRTCGYKSFYVPR